VLAAAPFGHLAVIDAIDVLDVTGLLDLGAFTGDSPHSFGAT
jgi:hypothetical protein